MKPVYQTKFGGSDAPDEEQGNCMAACIASIFEVPLEEAPDFTGHINEGRWFFQLQHWLEKRNLSILMLGPKPFDVPQGYAMAGVLSKTLANPEDGHMVAILNGVVVHDPNPHFQPNQEVLVEYEITEYWAFTCLEPSRMVLRLEEAET